MKRVRLWSVREDRSGELAAHDVASVRNTETEGKVEELLVRSPELLIEGLKLIGRQVMTKGGPLDLFGVDEDGRLVVFELKRGSLTRVTLQAAYCPTSSGCCECHSEERGEPS